jgi:mannosyl-oligosaccharide glucosidase
MVKLSQSWSTAVALALGASAAANSDPTVLANEIGRLNDESLLWGPYKPNLYFGVRPRLPEGLWTGLMWTGVSTFEQVPRGLLRHMPY